MPKPLTYNATLIDRIDITEKLAIYRIKPDRTHAARNGPWFRAGQYATIGLNNPQPALGGVRRPMSIASPPQQTEVVDFYIRYVDQPASDNPLTALLWRLDKGDRCYLRPGAMGRFTIADTVGDDDPRLRLFVAAGTGLAPFTSMTGDAVARRDPPRLANYAILHGASYPSDLAYRERLQALAEQHGLTYLPTVSRAHQTPAWGGYRGRVEDFFTAERLAATEQALGLEPGGLNGQRCVVFICGLQGTIKAALERLLPRGFVPNDRKLRQALGYPDTQPPSLFWEQYDNEAIIAPRDAADRAWLQGLRARRQRSA